MSSKLYNIYKGYIHHPTGEVLGLDLLGMAYAKKETKGLENFLNKNSNITPSFLLWNLILNEY